jgi:uncharacterized protein (DUF433 family)
MAAPAVSLAPVRLDHRPHLLAHRVVRSDRRAARSRRCGRASPALIDCTPPLGDTAIVKLDRIRIVPGVCEGRPTIRGLRITVEFVLKLLGDGYSADEIVREYPEVEKEDVFQAARFGSWLAGQRTSAVA